MHEKNIDEGKSLKFTGHYQFDAGKLGELNELTEDEIRNRTLSYTHNNGNHNLYKTKDGVWAVSFLYSND